ncbi:prohibitin family protein [Chloroflexota bacterium]
MGSIIGVVIIAASLISGSFTTIPTGHRGVVLRFSAVTGSILDECLKMKLPFIDSVEKMSVQTQKYEADSLAVKNDLQDVSTTIALNWHLDPSMAAEVYRTLGLEFIDRIAAPAIQETIKQITAQYNAEDLILRRDEVKAAITDSLSNRLFDRGIITETVSITNFSSVKRLRRLLKPKSPQNKQYLRQRTNWRVSGSKPNREKPKLKEKQAHE